MWITYSAPANRTILKGMNKQTFVRVAMVIFGVVGLVHLYRAFNDMPLLIGTTAVPVELSWAVGVVLLLLAWVGYKHSK